MVKPEQMTDFGRSLVILTKTNGLGCLMLARSRLAQPRPWQPPACKARLLQALLFCREAIAQNLQRERNRLEKNGSNRYHYELLGRVTGITRRYFFFTIGKPVTGSN